MYRLDVVVLVTIIGCGPIDLILSQHSRGEKETKRERETKRMKSGDMARERERNTRPRQANKQTRRIFKYHRKSIIEMHQSSTMMLYNNHPSNLASYLKCFFVSHL